MLFLRHLTAPATVRIAYVRSMAHQEQQTAKTKNSRPVRISTASKGGQALLDIIHHTDALFRGSEYVREFILLHMVFRSNTHRSRFRRAR